MKRSSCAILCILIVATLLRTLNTRNLLGFWYDQGRDAKVVWELIHHKNVFLIGPTTGIEGIFLGPFYYYFLAPFYAIGKGDPVVPAIGLGLVTSVAVFLLYRVGKKYISTNVGLLASLLYGFSAVIIQANRWLSNPTALPFFSLLIVWLLLEANEKKSFTNIKGFLLGFLVGISLQLEAASAIFFIPAVMVICWNIKKSCRIKTVHLFLIVLGLGFTLIPQILFDIRNDNLLGKSFYRFLVSEKSFRVNSTEFLLNRLIFFLKSFSEKLFIGNPLQVLGLGSVLISLIVNIKKTPSSIKKVIIPWILVPVVGLTIYKGNNGYVWDYYLTGVFPVFMLLVAVGVAFMPRILKAIFITCFISQNVFFALTFVQTTQPGYITLKNIQQAVDWIYEDAGNNPFNADVYVPPVIAHAYEYVFTWQSVAKNSAPPSADLQKILYTIVEPDLDHPYYRNQWLQRQDSYGQVDKEKTVGPLLVQKRIRYSK